MTPAVIIEIARLAVLGRERMREDGEPLAEQSVDLGWGELVADTLRAVRVCAGKKPIIQGLEGD